MSFKHDIDVVVTWVDGADPAWLAKKNQFANEGRNVELAKDATNTQRWHDSGTLQLVLRSIEQNMPWVRRIYLVTDGQTPRWLKPDDRLHLINHADIFGESVRYPTFNSHAIETRLHHVPGLAEHFIYFNDDVIVTKPLTPSDFFHEDGRCKVYLARRPARNEKQLLFGSSDSALQNVARMLGVEQDSLIKLRHQPFALRRSILLELEEKYAGQFRTTGQQRFRSEVDIAVVSQFFQHYCLMNGLATAEHARFFYVDVSRPITISFFVRIWGLNRCLAVCPNNAERMNLKLRIIMQALRRLLPKASRWETTS
jgi:Stealth protein CR2, conserved region 2/Stealth protein CR1, conserved region 1/Stealth protein CR3, conserved region 3